MQREATTVAFGDPRLPERFWSKVEVRDDGCWQWTAYIYPEGYGSYASPPGQSKRAHRYAYGVLVADPGELPLDHLCRNPSCVNPAHLEAVTHRENILRGVGVTAVNAAKTHCVHGHELSGENLTWKLRKDGWFRECRACEDVREAARIRVVADITPAIKEALDRLVRESGRTRADELRLAIDRHIAWHWNGRPK